MIDDDASPSPHQINDHPELAILAALGHSLLLARHALMAVHPVMMTEDEPDEHDAAAWLAIQLTGIACLLGDTIDAYRDVVTRPAKRARRVDDF